MRGLYILGASALIAVILGAAGLWTGILHIKGHNPLPSSTTPQPDTFFKVNATKASIKKTDIKRETNPLTSTSKPVEVSKKGAPTLPPFDEALTYLKSLQSSSLSPPEVEAAFKRFLAETLKLPQDQVNTLYKMAFWKGFVSLQRRWGHEEVDEFVQTFNAEKRLKVAGFRAKGLKLFTGVIKEADASFMEMKKGIEKIKERQGEAGRR